MSSFPQRLVVRGDLYSHILRPSSGPLPTGPLPIGPTALGTAAGTLLPHEPATWRRPPSAPRPRRATSGSS